MKCNTMLIAAVRSFLIGMLLLTLVAGCADDPEPAIEEPEEEQPEEEEPGTEITTGVFTMANLPADTMATSGDEAAPMYFSLEENKIIPAAQIQTSNWDIAFTSIYSSSIAVNNGKSTVSPGYGGPGKGGFYLVKYADIDERYYDAPGKPIKTLPLRAWFDEAFERVTTVPVSDDQFSIKKVELDYFSGTGPGWAYYDFYGQVFPDLPNEQKGHICYALPRPIVIRTAKGNYAKLIIYSMYKDAPEDPDRSHKPGFITLKYAIQKDGSKNLDIKETN